MEISSKAKARTLAVALTASALIPSTVLRAENRGPQNQQRPQMVQQFKPQNASNMARGPIKIIMRDIPQNGNLRRSQWQFTQNGRGANSQFGQNRSGFAGSQGGGVGLRNRGGFGSNGNFSQNYNGGNQFAQNYNQGNSFYQNSNWGNSGFGSGYYPQNYYQPNCAQSYCPQQVSAIPIYSAPVAVAAVAPTYVQPQAPIVSPQYAAPAPQTSYDPQQQSPVQQSQPVPAVAQQSTQAQTTQLSDDPSSKKLDAINNQGNANSDKLDYLNRQMEDMEKEIKDLKNIPQPQNVFQWMGTKIGNGWNRIKEYEHNVPFCSGLGGVIVGGVLVYLLTHKKKED